MIFLDIETTGLDAIKNKILSLGIIHYDKATGTTKEFYKEIKFDIDDPEFSEKAKELNANLIENGGRKYPLILAEKEAIRFLDIHDSSNFKVPVGYNISSFDMAFIQVHMPRLYKSLGYRSMCLNALIGFYANKTDQNFWDVKDAVKELVKKRGFIITHNALDDCRQGLEAYKILDELFVARV